MWEGNKVVPSFLFNQLLGCATDQECHKWYKTRNPAVNEAVHTRGKGKGAYRLFLRLHRTARVSTMMMLAYHNTWSPAADGLTDPGTEVLTKMKLLKEDLTIQVSGCKECLLLLSKTQLEVMVSSSV